MITKIGRGMNGKSKPVPLARLINHLGEYGQIERVVLVEKVFPGSNSRGQQDKNQHSHTQYPSRRRVNFLTEKMKHISIINNKPPEQKYRWFVAHRRDTD